MTLLTDLSDDQPALDAAAMAELAAIVAQLGPIADRLGSRAVIAQYEADIGDPAQTRAGTPLHDTTGPLPRFLPVRDILRINFNMHALVPDEAVPRRLARSARIPTDDNLATTIPYAPTLLDALQLVARYGDAVVPWYRRAVVPVDAEVQVSYGPVVPLGRIEALSTEIALATIHRIVETFVGDRIAAARINFGPAPVSSAVVLADRFSCPVTFGGTESYMVFPAEWGAAPSPYHDPLLWQDGVARCDADIRGLRDAPLLGRVRAHVIDCLDRHHMATIEETAQALGLSPRSLVRGLAAAGTSHHRIVDAERLRRARRLLAQPALPIAAIAEALDFADPSSFGRKCRAWFAASPAQLRRRMIAGQPV